MTVELKRLEPERDGRLVREAVGWLAGQPRFFQDCDAAWEGMQDAEDYLRLMREGKQADIGIFDGREFVGVITVTLEGKGTFNSHLMVRRGASAAVIAAGAAGVLRGLFGQGMKEGWSWLARKNHGARWIVEAIGMRLDSVEQIKGASHGQPIEWVRYSVRRV